MNNKVAGRSLRKNSYPNISFVLACIIIAILIIQPDSYVSWAVTISVVAPTVWLIFVGPKFLHRWESHRYIFVPWILFVIKLVIFYLVVIKGTPYLISVLSTR